MSSFEWPDYVTEFTITYIVSVQLLLNVCQLMEIKHYKNPH